MKLPRTALAPASLSLFALSLAVPVTALAQPGFTVPPAPTTFTKTVTVGSSATTFTGDAVLDAQGAAHLAWVSQSAAGGDQLTVCTYPRGAGACSATANLLPPNAAQNVDLGAPQVIIDAPDNLELLATTCCAAGNPTVVRWTSADNGATWALAPDSLSIGAIDDSIMVGDQLVIVGAKPDGTVVEQIRSAAGASALTSVGTSGDPGIGAKVAAAAGDILVASDSAPAGQPEVTTVSRQQALGGDTFGPATPLPAYPGEVLQSLASGVGGPWLMTRRDTSGVLDPPVLLRHWNGSSFDAPVTLPVPGQGDDQHFRLAIDGSGRLDVVWIGARENYRLWREVSSDAGKTWHSSLLDSNVTAPGIYPVLDAAGVGVALEIPAGAGSVVVQPLIAEPTLTLKAVVRFLRHKGLVLVITGKGALTPGTALTSGTSVVVQQQAGKHYPKIATGRLDKSGAFTVTLKLPKTGRYSYRVMTNGVVGRYDIATSPTVGLKIPQH